MANLRKLWMAFCPYCGASTGCKAPKSKDFTKIVQCSVCNKSIHAANGKIAILEPPARHEEENLLEIL